LPIKFRLWLLSALCLFGALLFLPFLVAGLGPSALDRWLIAVLLVLGSTSAGWLCSWAGLKWADRAHLPMPILRAWEMHTAVAPLELRRILVWGIGFGALAGAAVAAMSSALDLPVNSGTLPVRLLSVFFAASVTEIVAHLFLLGGLVLLFKRNWLGLFLSSVAFLALFHGRSLGDTRTTVIVLAANFSFSVLTGWLYLKRGFEAALVAHAAGHLIAVGWR
jgi:hypothetical protein